MIASPSFIFWTNLENLKALILAIRCILHSMKFAFDASLNSIRCILHSMDFAFDEIRFRWLQSVPWRRKQKKSSHAEASLYKGVGLSLTRRAMAKPLHAQFDQKKFDTNLNASSFPKKAHFRERNFQIKLICQWSLRPIIFTKNRRLDKSRLRNRYCSPLFRARENKFKLAH